MDVVLYIFRCDNILFGKSKLLCKEIMQNQVILEHNVVINNSQEEFEMVTSLDNIYDYSLIEIYEYKEDRIIHVKPRTAFATQNAQLLCIDDSYFGINITCKSSYLVMYIIMIVYVKNIQAKVTSRYNVDFYLIIE